MLLLGQHRQRTCTGISRRELLQIGGSSVLGLTLADLLKLKANPLALTPNPSHEESRGAGLRLRAGGHLSVALGRAVAA